MSQAKRDKDASILVGDVLEFAWKEQKEKKQETLLERVGPRVPDAVPRSFTLTLKAMGSKEDDSFFKQCISDLNTPAPMAIYSLLGFYKITYLGLDFYGMHLKHSN